MPYAIPIPRPARLALLILAVAPPMAGCDGTPTGSSSNDSYEYIAEDMFSFTVDVTTQARLHIEATNGTVTIAGVTVPDRLRVNGTRQVRSSWSQLDADGYLEILEVSVEETPDTFLVATDEPPASSGREYTVNYEIEVPDGLEVTVVSGNGDVTVVRFKNRVDVTAASGDVTLEDIEGSAAIQLVNGEVDAEVTLPLDGVVDVEVETGDITLRIPASTSAELYLEVGCCGWTLEHLNLQNKSETPPGVRPVVLTGTLGDGQGTISLVLGNGIITVIGT
ncbi:MAG: DUF4097 family beta strand repeat-containing protein [Gemmatimonadales bacterium]|jgi:DUF4097 and DUF4098 domain-containing protein YvlB